MLLYEKNTNIWTSMGPSAFFKIYFFVQQKKEMYKLKVWNGLRMSK